MPIIVPTPFYLTKWQTIPLSKLLTDVMQAIVYTLFFALQNNTSVVF
ncbi:MAG: hypothetical protein JNL70_05585 [Saprospiraceae bacterium]|nr:hypothetical protein [Saprospiraceae bacterium]